MPDTYASLVTAADGLTNEDRWKDRGAFFQSIVATLNRLYWADALILQRLQGNERSEENISFQPAIERRCHNIDRLLRSKVNPTDRDQAAISRCFAIAP